MSSFLILLHEINMMPELSPEEMQAMISRYKAWGERLRAAGSYLGSGKLESTGRVMREEAGKIRISDGPFTETKDGLGGYPGAGGELRARPRPARGRRIWTLGTIEIRRSRWSDRHGRSR